MTNLTKLFCDLLSSGSAINQADASQVAQHVAYLAHTHLPDGFWVDGDALEEHIANLQVCRRDAEQKMVDDARSGKACLIGKLPDGQPLYDYDGSDFDIDVVRNRLAQGKPVSVKRIIEFHNKLSITLSDGKELSFNAADIVHY